MKAENSHAINIKSESFLEIAGVMFVALDKKGTVTLINEKGCEILGFDEKNIVGKNWFDAFLPKRIRREVKIVYRKLMAGEIEPVKIYENPVLTKDGQERIILFHNTILRDESGKITGTLSSGEDITEKVQSEGKIRHLNRVLLAIRNVNQLIIKETDVNKLIKRACEILVETGGYFNAWITLLDASNKHTITAEAGLGKDILPMMERIKEGNFTTCASKALKQSGIMITENPHAACKDCPLSEKYAGRGAMTTRLECHGKIYGIMSVSIPTEFANDEQENDLFKEVTDDIAFALDSIEIENERKQAEEALKKEQNLLKTLMDNIPDHIYFKDTDSRFITINNAQAERFNISDAKHVIGKTDFDFFTEEHARQAFENEQEIIRTGKPIINMEEKETWSQHSETWVLTTKMPLIDENGNIVGTFGISRDITERKLVEEEVISTKARLEHLLTKSSAVIYSSTATEPFGATYISENVRDVIGFEPNDFLEDPGFWTNRIHPDDSARVFRELAKIFEAGYHNQEYRWKKKDGSYIWLHDDIRLVFDKKGTPIEIVGTWLDITERKQAEEALRENEQRLKEAQSIARIGRWDLDLSSNQLQWSDSIFELFEIDPVKFKATYEAFLNAIHPADRENVNSAYTESLKTKLPYEISHRLLMKDGRIKWVHEICRTEFDRQGKVLRSIGVVQDITERKQAEEALRSALQLNENIVKSSPIGILIYDSAGNCIAANNAAAEAVGATKDQVLQQNYHKIDSWKKSGLYDVALRSMQEKAKKRHEIQVKTTFGKVCILDIHLVPITIENEPHLLIMSDDITDRKQAEEKLLKISERLELAMDAGEHGFWDWNLDTNDVYFSPRYYTMLGYEPGELPMRLETWVDLMHPDDQKTIVPEVENYVKHAQAYEVEFRMKTKDGNWRWISGRGKSYKKDKDDIPHRAVGVHVNITERKQAEEALKDNENRLKIMFESAPDAYYLNDFEGKFTDGNKAAEALLGYSREELIGRNFVDAGILTIDQAEKAVSVLARNINGESSGPDEYTLIRKDGSTVNVEILTHPVVINGEDRVLGIARDITKRKQAEEALEEDEERYRQIFQFSPDSIIIHDMDMNLMAVNNKAVEEFGYLKEELLEKTIYELHSETELKHSDQVLAIMKKKGMLKVETKFIRKDGSVFLAEVTPCKYTLRGKPIIHVVIRDITVRKHAEEMIQKNLKEKEILLRELYHRTKNNMQVIISMLRMRSRSIQDENMLFTFGEIENKIQSMALVHQKLYESQDLSSLNLKSYFNDLISLIHQSYLMGDDRIKLNYEAVDAPVLIDTAMPLGLVLNELLSNAVKHAFPKERKGEIHVRLDAGPKKGLVIEVSDNGVGLPRGFNVEKDGNLGLQTVIDLAKYQLGGEVMFESKNGLRCRIVIKEELYLPRV
ncbi:PAS domain S-box protein [candidate division KSB1 bacterium]|nr:PAS domain S-box protein [candidate division KSB1 bacterium]